MMDEKYLDEMQAHVDAGGRLTHRNAVELLQELVRVKYSNKRPSGDEQ